MHTFDTISALQSHIRTQKNTGKRIGVVPTMGNLHEGHLALVKRAQTLCDHVVVSIFVNPLQFGANEDLDKYPRTLADDQAKLEAIGCDTLFTPTSELIYPEGLDAHTKVATPKLTTLHCGSARPGHFDGVTTIVCKLFNIVQADVAVFGEKDFQQLAVIRKMACDLLMPIEIIGHPTARAEDGLALSSRNQYLNAEERKKSPFLYQLLLDTQTQLLAQGKACDANSLNTYQAAIQSLEESSKKSLENQGFKIDYFNIVDAKNLQKVDQNSTECVILLAVFLGNTRLIDNVSFSLNTKLS